MSEIHQPDFYGDIKLATDPGLAGQVLTSAGVGVQAVWANNASGNTNSFHFISASALVHNINHNLGDVSPNITVWDQASGDVIGPSTVSATDANNTQITFFVARAIRGTIST